MNIKPMGSRVVLKVVKAQEKTAGGLVLPGTAQEKPLQAEVVAVGPGRVLADGSRSVVDVQVGDMVIYAKFAGTELKYEGEEYLVVDADTDILAVLC